ELLLDCDLRRWRRRWRWGGFLGRWCGGRNRLLDGRGLFGSCGDCQRLAARRELVLNDADRLGVALLLEKRDIGRSRSARAAGVALIEQNAIQLLVRRQMLRRAIDHLTQVLGRFLRETIFR